MDKTLVWPFLPLGMVGRYRYITAKGAETMDREFGSPLSTDAEADTPELAAERQMSFARGDSRLL